MVETFVYRIMDSVPDGCTGSYADCCMYLLADGDFPRMGRRNFGINKIITIMGIVDYSLKELVGDMPDASLDGNIYTTGQIEPKTRHKLMMRGDDLRKVLDSALAYAEHKEGCETQAAQLRKTIHTLDA
jgi:hypothetical protein